MAWSRWAGDQSREPHLDEREARGDGRPRSHIRGRGICESGVRVTAPPTAIARRGRGIPSSNRGTPHRGATLESIAVVFCLFSEGPDFRAGAERDVEVFRGQLEEAKAQGICVDASLEVEFYELWVKNSRAARGNGEQSKVQRLT